MTSKTVTVRRLFDFSNTQITSRHSCMLS